MLRLTAEFYEAIRLHGEETYPHECCGVLLGRSETGVAGIHDGAVVNVAEAAVRAENTRSDSAHNRYSIAPRELIRIQRQGREHGSEIVGFYHSHPDHPARWSSTDLAEAHWLGCSYVITSVVRGVAQQTNAFLLTGTSEEDKALIAEPIEVDGAIQEKADESLRSVPA
jgi:proteasome lid subunit RPN8/RPN11